MADFRFTNELSGRDIGQVIDMLRRPRLYIPTSQDYPRHQDWLHETEADLQNGSKRAMVATASGRAIGTVVYRLDVNDPTLLAIRNISVSPSSGGRLVGSFLLRNAEIEAAQHDFPGLTTAVVDTKTTNYEMIGFLQSQGYTLNEVKDLYHDGTGQDMILAKSLS